MRLLAKVAACSLMLAALAGPAMAADAMASAYGNTVSVTYPDGTTVKLFIEADGTYTSTGGPSGDTMGAWAIKGGQTCFTQTSPEPPAGTSPSCSPTVTKNVGDTWTAPGQGGATATITITAGR
ncbi:hypothetical protein QO010_000665 [Caulobacter ginsengisoli]|uniref:Secreted protein n=1 Tax=Caulobacter ginsengisoli TaxID=400775 RepID=A0ABU0IPM5_9CAUL|nr:hypothetical protein [Caulobacter ginsengisoli]MDQ0462917.1 hypothetical protein [Caulobacter ginsengisoli]